MLPENPVDPGIPPLVQSACLRIATSQYFGYSGFKKVNFNSDFKNAFFID